MHISKESFSRIVKEYGLPTDMAMFSQAPQISTYHMRVPVDEDHIGMGGGT